MTAARTHYTARMRSLFRLLTPARRAPQAPALQREHRVFTFDDGQSIALLQVRDARAKRLKLSVDDRGARLTLPLRSSTASGERFLHQHRDWLLAQLHNHVGQAGERLQLGVTTALPLRGHSQPLLWQPGRSCRLQRQDDDSLCFSAPASASPAALRRALRDFYEAEARADVGRWLPHYLPELPHPPRKITFKRTRSQWGSLAPDRSLSLDLSLILAPSGAFEYVLVHELCHLLQANHSPAFWAEVQQRFPHWRRERGYLRSDGRALKGRLQQLLAG